MSPYLNALRNSNRAACRALSFALSFALPLALPLSASAAADLEAGKAKVQAVCAACHGANGVSVSDAIPNLAGQRVAYLEAQLRAWKDGTRKNPIMNAIGAQLAPDEIANVAAYFASLPGASGPKSELFPALAKSPIAFPEGYRVNFTQYHAIDMPATKQVRYYFANPVAVRAAKAGQAMPDGALLFVEVHTAKLDADKKPLRGADGHFVPDQLVSYTAMGREAGWGQDVPEMLRNENWNYAVFTPAKQQRAGVNQAECLACHKPQDKVSYMFTLDTLTAAVRPR
jgi:cytochrome c553